MKRTFIFLATGAAGCLLGCTSAFSPVAPPQAAATRPSPLLSSSLFQQRATRMAPSLFAEEKSSSSSSSKKSGLSTKLTKSSKSVFRKIDEYGIALKPKAMEAKEKITTMKKPSKKFRYRLQACGLFSLFILYRAYRGFFVILPAIFREVYKTMEKTVDSPFTDDVDDPVSVAMNGEKQDVNPKTGKLRLRTSVVVSLLAGIVTLSYTVTGALRVLGQFLRTVTKTSSASSSFLAAADEMEANESKIMKLTDKKKNNIVNGDTTTTLDGLGP